MNDLTRQLEEYINDIRRSIDKAQTGMVEIGYNLAEIKNKGLEQEKGYCDIWSLAKEEFGFEQSTTSRMIGIYEKYGTVEFGIPKLKGQYSAFNKGQLIEMLNVPEEVRQEIEPSATVQDIREIKRELKTKEEPIPCEDEGISKVIKALFRKEEYAKRFPKVMKELISNNFAKTKEINIRMAITGSGNGAVKAAGVMIFFKEDTVTILQNGKKEYTYILFANEIAKAFNCGEEDSKEKLIERWEETLGEAYPREPEPEPVKVKAVATSHKEEPPKKKTKAIENDCKQEKQSKEVAEPVKEEQKQEPKKEEPIPQPHEEEPEEENTEEENTEAENTEVENIEAAVQPEEEQLEEVIEGKQLEPEELEAVVEEAKCECCQGEGIHIREGFGSMKVRTVGPRLIVFDGEDAISDIKINYCPYCGREV